MAYPFFSVVIPVYNKQDFILDTILSVARQTYIDFEIVCVNDGSHDNSLLILESFLSIVV